MFGEHALKRLYEHYNLNLFILMISLQVSMKSLGILKCLLMYKAGVPWWRGSGGWAPLVLKKLF